MNKLLRISIFFSIIAGINTFGMYRAENVAPLMTQKERNRMLARQREEARIQRIRENRVNNQNIRRPLNHMFALYDRNRGEGAYPANNYL